MIFIRSILINSKLWQVDVSTEHITRLLPLVIFYSPFIILHLVFSLYFFRCCGLLDYWNLNIKAKEVQPGDICWHTWTCWWRHEVCIWRGWVHSVVRSVNQWQFALITWFSLLVDRSTVLLSMQFVLVKWLALCLCRAVVKHQITSYHDIQTHYRVFGNWGGLNKKNKQESSPAAYSVITGVMSDGFWWQPSL